MSDPNVIEDFEAKLRTLTQRQSQILHMVCQGMTFKQIAKQIDYGVDTVTAEMSHVYRTLGLTRRSRNEKRNLLVRVICPIHERLLNSPGTDISSRLIDIGPVDPDPETIQEVKDDEQRGLIPIDRSLVPLTPTQASRGLAKRTPSSLSPWPSIPIGPAVVTVGFMAGILVTLLIVAVIIIGILVLAGGPQKLIADLQPSPVSVLQTVVITQPPVIVVATSPPATPALTLPPPSPTNVEPTAVVAAPSAPSPLPATGNAPCSGTLNLAGKAASEIPGTPLCVGGTVSSVVDQNTKPRDVYALDLAAGQEYRFTAESSHGCLYVILYNPNSKSLETNRYSQAFSDSECSGRVVDDFTPAISGTYYFSVNANSTGVNYTLNTKPTTVVIPGNQISSDIPGTKFSVGSNRSSVVDQNTKPRDVYALDLAAGQDVRFTVESTHGCLYIILYNPSSKSIETNQVSQAFSDSACSGKAVDDFTPAVAGTYFFSVNANSSGVTYSLNVINLK